MGDGRCCRLNRSASRTAACARSNEVSLQVGAGQFVAIVGPNGAGKTTLFKAISGIVAAGVRAHRCTRAATCWPCRRRSVPHLGIAHVPEGRQVFRNMTVLENLEMGAHLPPGRAAWPRNLERIFGLFPVLADRRDQLAGTLSGGEQQMLAIGRGLASSSQAAAARRAVDGAGAHGCGS